MQQVRAPAPPLFVSLECLKDLSADVSWMPGFNGGSEQMFVIQYRQSSENNFKIWTKKLQDKRINITENVKGLTNGVEYRFRVVAVNSYGETPSDEYSCTTEKPTLTESPIVLPIVGGTLGTLTGVAASVDIKPNDAKKRNDEFSMNGNDINIYERLNKSQQELDANTYETITNRQIAEFPKEKVYVNTAIGMADGIKQ
ncbi:hypothetical protein KUTeg_005939 [Tegillarca granosa]|uniref:Fibronectin type-III domain-containing protein n=1 Tax=Tegillarca granosa TaxID=220873 RepID=A0ABQ9FJ01_TEGGR|nr:hypothetical protein KUTeg_005939 [Tegillarca granosa]